MIDGVLSFGPANGANLGFHKIARHLYHPGRMTPASGIDLLVNQQRWEAIGAAGQSLLQQACERNAAQMLDRWLEDQRASTGKLAQQAVMVEPLPDAVVVALRDSWHRVRSARRDEPAFTALANSLRRYADGN
jgi:TRAP-type mannitol/chloroaromatic compound transport system substrate-binding protein